MAVIHLQSVHYLQNLVAEARALGPLEDAQCSKVELLLVVVLEGAAKKIHNRLLHKWNANKNPQETGHAFATLLCVQDKH